MPDVPTFEELGFKGVDANSYWGLYAPAATPPEVLDKLNQHFAKALRSPELADRIKSLGYEVIANTPAEHSAQMRQIIAFWAGVVEAAKIKVD